jgi:rhodanese-related sulfurtransferase
VESDDLTQPEGVYARRDAVQIVDVREPYEWEAGHIDGAVHIPLNQLMAGTGQDLDRGRPVVAVCRSGNRSELAALMLQARGYEAHNMRGGMEAWEAAGLPFAAADGTAGRIA